VTSVLFLTGFPGFLGSTLLPRLLADRPLDRAICLVQPRWAPLATQAVGQLSRVEPHTRGRIELIEGDITEPGLALARGIWRSQVSEVFHFAAAYDLAVPAEIARQVNVLGTRHLIDVCADFPGLRRFHHVSTCFVSGRHPGTFRETDLDVGQTFANAYEESKHGAEHEVQHGADGGLPVTIYRPSLVAGDSRTGATSKYDGPYVLLGMLLRQRRVALLPVTGRPRDTPFNIVPSDYVANAIAFLSKRAASLGTTYHLADPAPQTIDRLITLMAYATRRKVIRVPVPYALGRRLLTERAPMRRLLRLPPQALDYFVHPTMYDTTNAERDLATAQIAVPRFGTYVDKLVAFMTAHPEIPVGGMR
jgi:thioester reductase-like protein